MCAYACVCVCTYSYTHITFHAALQKFVNVVFFYIAQYPVCLTPQSALHFLPPPWQSCSFHHQLGFFQKHYSQVYAQRLNHLHSHHCLQPGRPNCYSFIKLSQLVCQWRERNVRSSKHITSIYCVISSLYCS